jgi:adenylate cyclase
MDRVWDWAWDHHGKRYSWAVFSITCGVSLPIFVLPALIVLGFEHSDRYLAAVVIAAGIAAVRVYVISQPGFAVWRPMERWAAGDRGDPLEALESTYTLARKGVARGVVSDVVSGGTMTVIVGAIAGASASRLIQYGVVGSTMFLAVDLVAAHSFVEGFVRPVRVAIAGDSTIGDGLPRTRPTFAQWSNTSILATAWAFTLSGAMLAAVIDRTSQDPGLVVVIAAGMTVFFAVPITVGAAFAPSLRPLQDLAQGTERVAAGDYSRRLPVVQDDDLGALAASFNRMQAGLAERERLQAAFGSYVDPALATRLLEQSGDLFAGERREVTVMFVDIRDFTPFAEVNTAEDTISHLNALFEIVVPAVIDSGGHVNKYLGDGAMAVFGAPNVLDHHADAAVRAAIRIHQMVAEHFDGTLRIGTGINTGQVIAGTIGGGGKLEFTLIGDAVNVAARVEQLTKLTGDAILITQDTLDALSDPPAGLTDRGAHELKGKAATVHVHALDPAAPPTA